MIDEELKKKIISSFKNSEFSKVLELTEKIDPKVRPPGLENIIGVSKYHKKDVTSKDLQESFLCFERAFLKNSDSLQGLEGLLNIIKLGTKVSPILNNFSKVLYKASDYYLRVEKNYERNEEFLKAGIILFSYLLDHDNLKKTTKKIFNTSTKSKFLRGLAIFENNYYNDWKQTDHLNYAKENSKYFSKLKVKDLNQIDYTSNKKLNIGLVGCDFERNHSTTFFIKDTIKYLNRDKFEVSIFSITKKNVNDQSQNELRNLSDNWFDTYDLNNQQLAELIQKKKIDVLIDLMGYTKPERLELFNSRIAPKQVSWLAYCNTTGLDTIDYLIADKNLIFNSEEKFYSEKIIKLPHIWNCHSGFENPRKLNELPFFKNNIFTFGSLNNFRKISDDVIESWSKILQQVPNSKLILKSSTPCDKESLLNKFKKYHVDQKINILNKSDFKKKRDHLNLYNNIDLCLDTFPYNGVTTTFEALWMSVPVLVIKGSNFNSRCGVSIIKNLNINSLISENKDDYILKAIKFSEDKNSLIEIKKKIYENVIQSPLFNTKQFSNSFSDCLINLMNNK